MAGIGKRKKVFALFPVQRLVRDKKYNYFRVDGKYWMRWVVLFKSLNGWKAYADENDA